MQYAFF